MKKLLLSSFTILALSIVGLNTANAQIQFGLNVGAGIPMGAFGDAPTIDLNANNNKGNIVATASSGFGLNIFGKYFLNDKMALGLNVGYISFGGQDVNFNSVFGGTNHPNVTGSFKSMPIALSYDYYFMTDKIKPYAGLELGYIITTENHTYPAALINSNSDQTSSNSASGLLIAPLIGVAYGLNDNFDLFLNLKYSIGMNTRNYDFSQNANPNVGFPNTHFFGINIGAAYKIK